MKTPETSIIIPHYEDTENLSLCLDQLARQTNHAPFEVIIIDDGSPPESQPHLQRLQQNTYPYIIRWEKQEHKLQGAARNLGAQLAHSELLLFIQSDVLPEPELISTHQAYHKAEDQQRVASMGPYPFSPSIMHDRFCRWLQHSGNQAKFDTLQDKHPIDCFHCYSGNLAIKKAWFLNFGFREEFKSYGWEDICLGHEMIQAGGTITFLAHAKAWHNHLMQSSSFFSKRMFYIGQSAVTLRKIHPDIPIIPSGYHRLLREIKGSKAFLNATKHLRKEWHWNALCAHWFLKGVKSACEG